MTANEASLPCTYDELFESLSEIAMSYTEDLLNKAAQSLESSDVWQSCEALRDWFSAEWLAEAKVKCKIFFKWALSRSHHGNP